MPIPSYPFDATGTLPACLIAGEQQILSGGQDLDYYFLVPKLAPFFEASFSATIQVGSTSRSLVKGQDFYYSHLFAGAERGCAKPIWGSISILNPALVGVVTMQYQTLGGDWVIDSQQIATILADQTHNPRTTTWENVANPPYAFPVINHPWNLVDMVGMSDVVNAVGSLEDAVRSQSTVGLEAHLADLNNPHAVTAQQVGAYDKNQADARIALLVNSGISTHVGLADPHPQYTTADEVTTLIGQQVGAVRQPKNVTPASQATNISQTPVLQGSPYYSLYGLAQSGAQFQISTRQDFATVTVDSGTLAAVSSFSVPSGLSANVAYFWRVRHRDSENVWSAWSVPTAFSTGSIIVQQPSITSPTPGATGVSVTLTATSSAFAVSGGTDSHQSSDWEIRTASNGGGTLVYGSLGTTTSKTSLSVPAGNLSPNQTYYVRVRYNALGAGTSAWSADSNFTTTGVVQAPVISSPSNNATGITETPTIVASAFAVTGGTDTHQQTFWEIWTGPNGTGTRVWNYGEPALSGTPTQETVPPGFLQTNTTYYARVQYWGTNLGASAWSADAKFTTAAQFVPTVPGTPYQGGYYAGRIRTSNGQIFGLIVSPKAAGQYYGPFAVTGGVYAPANSPYFWKNDGWSITNQLLGNPTLFPSIVNFVNSMRNNNIGGYNDWYVPARDELELMYRNLKATADPSFVGNRQEDGQPYGLNTNSVPVGSAYTNANPPNAPAQTTVTAFVTGGSESFEGVDYWSSSFFGDGSSNDFRVDCQNFGVGNQFPGSSDGSARTMSMRLVRRFYISG